MKFCNRCKVTKLRSEFYRTHAYCKPCSLDYRREDYAKNKRRYYHYEAKYKFGVTKQQYDEMYLKQDGCCASCGFELSGRSAIDHNHASGEFRGILCLNCNIAFGQMWEDPDLIRKLLAYAEGCKNRGDYAFGE